VEKKFEATLNYAKNKQTITNKNLFKNQKKQKTMKPGSKGWKKFMAKLYGFRCSSRNRWSFI
jgi:hypothetical protein